MSLFVFVFSSVWSVHPNYHFLHHLLTTMSSSVFILVCLCLISVTLFIRLSVLVVGYMSLCLSSCLSVSFVVVCLQTLALAFLILSFLYLCLSRWRCQPAARDKA